MGILLNMARRKSQSLTCRCPPGTLWAKAEGIEEVLNSNRGNETTFVQLHPIPFPGVKTPKRNGPPSVRARECSTAGQCHPLHTQRHIVAHKVPDLSSKGWEVYSNIGQHNHPRLVLIAVCLPWQQTADACSRRTLGVLSSSVMTSTRAIGGYTPFTLEQDSRRLCKKAESSGASNRSSSFNLNKRTGSSWASSPLKQAPYFRQPMMV